MTSGLRCDPFNADDVENEKTVCFFKVKCIILSDHKIM